jgi:hypothetical protein
VIGPISSWGRSDTDTTETAKEWVEQREAQNDQYVKVVATIETKREEEENCTVYGTRWHTCYYYDASCGDQVCPECAFSLMPQCDAHGHVVCDDICGSCAYNRERCHVETWCHGGVQSDVCAWNVAGGLNVVAWMFP